MIRNFLGAHWNLIAELAELFLLLGVIVFLAGVLIARFDKISIADGVYFAFMTALTVGFGDLVPKERASKIIAVILAILGIIVIGMVVAVSVHALDQALDLSVSAAGSAVREYTSATAID